MGVGDYVHEFPKIIYFTFGGGGGGREGDCICLEFLLSLVLIAKKKHYFVIRCY